MAYSAFTERSMKSTDRRTSSASTSSMLNLAFESIFGCGGSGPPSAIVCLPTLPQRGSVVAIVDVGRLGVYDIAWAKPLQELGALRVIGFIRLFHGVEVIEDAVELVEAVHRGKVFVTVTEMVLADLRRCVAQEA